MNGLGFLFGGLAFVFLVPVVVAAVALAYVALRVRDARTAVADKYLGLKTAFHTLHTTAVLTLLGGLSMSAADLMEGQLTGNARKAPGGNFPFNPGPVVVRPGQPPPAPPPNEFWNPAQRSAAALAASGLLFGLVFWGLLVGSTNDGRFTAVRRTFLGGRLALALMIVFGSTTAVAVTLAQKDPQLESVEPVVGVLVVWVVAAVVHLYLFLGLNRKPTEPEPAAATRPAPRRVPANLHPPSQIEVIEE